MIYELLSALKADIGENRCGTVMTKLLFFITNYSCNIKMWVIISKLPKGNNLANILELIAIVNINIVISQK